VSTILTHTLADVLRTHLIAEGVVEEVAGTNWPCYLNHLPDTDNNTVTLYDTEGRSDGRDMQPGAQTASHPGVQLAIRGAGFRQTWAKVKAITEALDLVRKTAITHKTINYILEVITRPGDPINGGLDQERKQRFTINVLGSFKEA